MPSIPTPSIRPYRISVPQSEIDDLNSRLARARWPDRETASDWQQGVPLEAARKLAEYWQVQYSWRRFEEFANQYPQYTTNIDGLDIHYFHIRSKEANSLPILLLHGWPGSFVEFLKCIEALTDPVAHGGRAECAFDIVLPSLPGWGFTEAPKETGWNMERTSRACIELMEGRLGYKRWGAQGGDYGAAIATLIARSKPPGLMGIHLNLLFVIPESLDPESSGEEQEAMAAFARTQTEQSGYKHISSTRPQTISYALSDSAIGQMTWIYEKYHDWTDNDGDPSSALSVDEMLDNISVHWFSRSAGSISRVFWEARNFNWDMGELEVPVAALVFERDIFKYPKKWIEKAYPKLFHFTRASYGGHFGAFEQPQVLVEDLRTTFEQLSKEASV